MRCLVTVTQGGKETGGMEREGGKEDGGGGVMVVVVGGVAWSKTRRRTSSDCTLESMPSADRRATWFGLEGLGLGFRWRVIFPLINVQPALVLEDLGLDYYRGCSWGVQDNI